MNKKVIVDEILSDSDLSVKILKQYNQRFREENELTYENAQKKLKELLGDEEYTEPSFILSLMSEVYDKEMSENKEVKILTSILEDNDALSQLLYGRENRYYSTRLISLIPKDKLHEINTGETLENLVASYVETAGYDFDEEKFYDFCDICIEREELKKVFNEYNTAELMLEATMKSSFDVAEGLEFFQKVLGDNLKYDPHFLTERTGDFSLVPEDVYKKIYENAKKQGYEGILDKFDWESYVEDLYDFEKIKEYAEEFSKLPKLDINKEINGQTNEFIKLALDNAKRIPMGEGKTYLDVMLNQRIEGPSNAGSSYKVNSSEELYDKLTSQDWEETTHSDVMPGCKVFKSKLAGLEGILNMENLPDDVELYAIDPKGTGKIGIGAGKVAKNPVEETYLIIGKENIDGKDEDVVFTFHPGEPVRPSEVETKDIPDGTRLSKEEAQKLGFDKVKYLSDEMLEEYRHKQKALELEEKISEVEELNLEISKAEKSKEEK